MAVHLEIHALRSQLRHFLGLHEVEYPPRKQVFEVDPKASGHNSQESMFLLRVQTSVPRGVENHPGLARWSIFYKHPVDADLRQMQLLASSLPQEIHHHGIEYREIMNRVIGCKVHRYRPPELSQNGPCS